MSTEVEVLNRAFQDVGRRYGYDNVKADYVPFLDMKVQWQRSFKWAAFRVSDYMKGADGEVLECLANTLFSKITGENDKQYGEAMRSWVLDPDFSITKRPMYLKRSRTLTKESAGLKRNLADSMTRLAEKGLVDPGANVQTVWSLNNKLRRAASSSVLMRVIAVSDLLDDDKIPDYVVDYAVYCQYLRIIHGAENFGITTEIFTRDYERKFDKYKEAEAELDRLCIYI